MHNTNETTSLELTSVERKTINILVVEPDGTERTNFLRVLEHLGFGSVTSVADHQAGVRAVSERPITHVIFSAQKSNSPVEAFLEKILEFSPSIIALATSSHPNVDNVFDLLRIGARGFLVKPISVQAVDGGICMATKGEPFSQVILQAHDRNEAFSALLAACLDKASTALRDASKYSSAEKDYAKYMTNFRSAAALARTFANGGDEALQLRLSEFMIKLADEPPSKLGRLRKRLRVKREGVNSSEERKETEAERIFAKAIV